MQMPQITHLSTFESYFSRISFDQVLKVDTAIEPHAANVTAIAVEAAAICYTL